MEIQKIFSDGEERIYSVSLNSLETRLFRKLVGENKKYKETYAYNRKLLDQQRKEFEELEKRMPSTKEDIEKWDKYNKSVEEEQKRTKLTGKEKLKALKVSGSNLGGNIKHYLKGGKYLAAGEGNYYKDSVGERAKNIWDSIKRAPEDYKYQKDGMKYQKAEKKLEHLRPKESAHEKAREAAWNKIYQKYDKKLRKYDSF